jgi:hypothetical protein
MNSITVSIRKVQHNDGAIHWVLENGDQSASSFGPDMRTKAERVAKEVAKESGMRLLYEATDLGKAVVCERTDAGYVFPVASK